MRSNIKRTIAMALTLCAISAGTIAPNAGKFILSPTPLSAEAATRIGDFTFTRRSTNAATLTSYLGSATNLTLPTEVTINGAKCTVSGIDQGAFSKNNTLVNVTIPSSYSNISKEAFMYCSKLTNISIPSSIVAIQDYAFYGSGITNVTVPSNVKILGEAVFQGCDKLVNANINTTIITELKRGMFNGCSSLQNLNIPSSIKTLGDKFASGCTSLKSLNLPNNLSKIGVEAFKDCTNLQTLNFPSTISYVGGNAFVGTKWIKNQSATNGIVIKNRIIIDVSRASGTVNIPSGVTKIPAYLFSYNTAITKVVMPNTLSTIEEHAFENCPNLTTVQFPNELSAIPQYCFYFCPKLKNVTLPNKLMTIGYASFSNCTSLTSINFPEYLKKIEYGAFSGCSSLNNITNILDYKTYDIDGKAFDECYNLKKINGTTVVTRSGNNVSVYKESFVKKYFSKTDDIGFIKDFVEYKSSAVVDQIKAKYPNYKPYQIARELEKWMCANGCSPFENWKKVNGNTNYPSDLENWDEYHRESSILLNGVGVCEGWAKCYNLLLKKAGITSEIVASYNHEWNVVKFDGKWFNIDSYWDDNGNASAFDYFMVSSNEIFALEKKNGDTRNCHEQVIVKRRKENSYSIDYEKIPCTTPMGDINADTKLDNKDATALQNYLTTGKTSGTFINICADMNFDGKINATDLSLLKQKILNNK